MFYISNMYLLLMRFTPDALTCVWKQTRPFIYQANVCFLADWQCIKCIVGRC